MRSLILSVYLLILCSSSLYAQITQYTTENSGIASNYVADIQLADDGMVWVVHPYSVENTGLVSRFDGTEWTVFTDLPEIYDAALYGNALILATQTGVYEYSDGVFNRIEAIGEIDCRSVQVDNTMLWARVYPYSYFYDYDTLSQYNLATDTLIQNWLVSDGDNLLGFDEDGALWYRSDNGLYRYNGTNWQWFRDILIDRIYVGSGFFPDLATDGDGNVWLGMDSEYHAIKLDGTTFYRTTESLGNAVIGPDGTVWSFLTSELYRFRNNLKEHVYSFYPPVANLAITDSSLWVGGDGVTEMSLEYLLSVEADDSIPCTLEPFATATEPHTYGDDYWYFPLHIGDNWKYERSIYRGLDSYSYSDTVVNTVVDTLTVNGEICYALLDGRIYGIDHAGLINENGNLRFSFEDPENTSFQFNSYYSYFSAVTRTYRTISVPAGDFMGYSFSFGAFMGGNGYKIIPGIGLASEYWGAETNEYSAKLISATIGGRTIDEIMPVENTPQPYSLDLTAYPNPFNPATTIGFSLPESAPVTLAVYNLAGQKVDTLLDDKLSAGAHTVTFDGTGLASGVYVYRLESPGLSGTGKMLLMK